MVCVENMFTIIEVAVYFIHIGAGIGILVELIATIGGVKMMNRRGVNRKLVWHNRCTGRERIIVGWNWYAYRVRYLTNERRYRW